MTEKKRKTLYWIFKLLSVFVACALPIWAICEKFPLWTEKHDTGYSIGVGAILIFVVILVVFRRTIFDYIREKIDLKHAPPLTVWLVMLVISYILVYLGNVMRDMTTVFWMGLIGCAIGNVLTYIAQSKFADKEKEDG